ncbi:hypothetical protein [Streptacidiphilus rugosus]|uniref:hypothetical protein n=1 Tax=Streptacidiphilus rugosus TaxID=405783 RepID=UPI0006924B6F|nr:hypothetical protein [Streptacidiphilus rugosus]
MNHSTHTRVDPHLTPLESRLAALRGDAAARSMDARALAALAANPGCGRRAVLDAAGVDKAALATRLGSPVAFGQSPFAITRGLAFERRLRADHCAELVALLRARLLPEASEQAPVEVPDLLVGEGLAVRAARTRAALADATKSAEHDGAWTLLDHPLLRLEVAGSTVSLEPDAVVVRPDGRWTVVEIKSFPILDGGADPAKVGAAARQAAVYVLALRATAAALDGVTLPTSPYAEPEGLAAAPTTTGLLVCPRDFSNVPVAAPVDLRKQLAVTQRQLARLTRVEQLLATLPAGARLDEEPTAVDALAHAYSPDCLAACELAFHCRAQAREAGAVETLGRGVRGELGSLTTVSAALTATTPGGSLARAAQLRHEALTAAGARTASGEGCLR